MFGMVYFKFICAVWYGFAYLIVDHPDMILISGVCCWFFEILSRSHENSNHQCYSNSAIRPGDKLGNKTMAILCAKGFEWAQGQS